MMLVQNKENQQTKSNQQTNTSNTKQKVICHKAYTGSRKISQDTLIEQIQLKVYQERRNNVSVYEKIKHKFKFFDYELRPPLKIHEPLTVMMKQYDCLLEERQFLEREWRKMQFQLRKATQQTGNSFHFLVKEVQLNHSQKCQDTIDRLNKTLVLMKRGIEGCLQEEKQKNCEFIYQAEQNISGEVSLLKQTMKERIEQLEQSVRLKSGKIEELIVMNRELVVKVEQMHEKNKRAQIDQVSLYEKISKLTSQLMQKDQKIQELKIKRNSLQRYISKEVNENHQPLYEVYIKNNHNTATSHLKLDDFYISKTITQIQAFLKENQSHQSFDIKSRQQISVNEENIIETQELQRKYLQSDSEKFRQSHCFSSSKKTKRTRQFLTRQSLTPTSDLKQMLFIRRK